MRVIAAMLVSLTLVSCAPYVAHAPIGGRTDRVCSFVRDQVKAGALPLEHALTYYRHCEPFEAPA